MTTKPIDMTNEEFITHLQITGAIIPDWQQVNTQPKIIVSKWMNSEIEPDTNRGPIDGTLARLKIVPFKSSNEEPTQGQLTDSIAYDELINQIPNIELENSTLELTPEIKTPTLKDLKKLTLELALNEENRALEVFEKITKCSDNPEKITELADYLQPNDFLCMRTTHIRYPRPMLQYALGSEDISQNVINMLVDNNPTDLTFMTQFYDNQLLHNSVRGHREAIKKIALILDEMFDINYQDEHGLNALKLAILHEHDSSFFKFLLDLDDPTESLWFDEDDEIWEDSIWYYALESPLKDSCNDNYIEIINLLVKECQERNIMLPPRFITEYFNKKKLLTTKNNDLYIELENKLINDGVDQYFDQCENPLQMAKSCYDNLKKQFEDYKKEYN